MSTDFLSPEGEPGNNLPVAQPAYAQVSPANITSLNAMQVMDVELISEYWTPGGPGEKKRVIFDSIRPSQTIDQQSGNVIDLECAFFWEEYQGTSRLIRNGSKRLVGGISSLNLNGFTPLEIVYKGKKKNATNGFSADDWSVKILGPVHV